jgi:hypothetical protein
MNDKQRVVKKTLSIPSWLNEMAEVENIPFSNVLANALMDKLDCHSYEEYLRMTSGVEWVAPTYCRECTNATEDGYICFGTVLLPAHSTFPDSYCSEGRPRDHKE